MSDYVITIARTFGSGGRTIGIMLSEALGIPYYDKDLIRLASDESGINESLFGMNDEYAKKTIFKKPPAYDGTVLPPDDPDFTSAKNLFNFQAKTIEKLADKESCIIIGRCADHVLKDRKNVLRVFIWADRAHCIENVMRINSVVDKKEAVKQIERIDKERSTYYKNYTGHSWDDVRNYDLCLNTGDLGFERCVDIISYCAKLLK